MPDQTLVENDEVIVLTDHHGKYPETPWDTSKWIAIELPRPIHQIGYQIAKDRNEKAKKYGDRDYKKKPGTGEKTHRSGVWAELACALFFDVDADLRIFDSHGDDGVDIITRSGIKIDVKGNNNVIAPWLRVEREHFKNDDTVYVNCALDFPIVYLVGWISAKDLLRNKCFTFRYSHAKQHPVNYGIRDQSKLCQSWGRALEHTKVNYSVGRTPGRRDMLRKDYTQLQRTTKTVRDALNPNGEEYEELELY